jgi:hypothetical protein
MVDIHVISLSRAEGFTYECYKPVFKKTYEEVDEILRHWSLTAPMSQFGHHKVDFVIYFSDGYEYAGTYPLTQNGFQSLKQYCQSIISWHKSKQTSTFLDTYFG